MRCLATLLLWSGTAFLSWLVLLSPSPFLGWCCFVFCSFLGGAASAPSSLPLFPPASFGWCCFTSSSYFWCAAFFLLLWMVLLLSSFLLGGPLSPLLLLSVVLLVSASLKLVLPFTFEDHEAVIKIMALRTELSTLSHHRLGTSFL